MRRHITANKNTIPNDPKSPFVTSGIRLGTPSVTSRGMNTEDMDRIAEAIAMVIKEGEDGVAKARAIVDELVEKYPLKYPVRVSVKEQNRYRFFFVNLKEGLKGFWKNNLK